jgi:hypothetical protein
VTFANIFLKRLRSQTALAAKLRNVRMPVSRLTKMNCASVLGLNLRRQAVGSGDIGKLDLDYTRSSRLPLQISSISMMFTE